MANTINYVLVGAAAVPNGVGGPRGQIPTPDTVRKALTFARSNGFELRIYIVDPEIMNATSQPFVTELYTQGLPVAFFPTMDNETDLEIVGGYIFTFSFNGMEPEIRNYGGGTVVNMAGDRYLARISECHCSTPLPDLVELTKYIIGRLTGKAASRVTRERAPARAPERVNFTFVLCGAGAPDDEERRGQLPYADDVRKVTALAASGGYEISVVIVDPNINSLANTNYRVEYMGITNIHFIAQEYRPDLLDLNGYVVFLSYVGQEIITTEANVLHNLSLECFSKPPLLTSLFLLSVHQPCVLDPEYWASGSITTGDRELLGQVIAAGCLQTRFNETGGRGLISRYSHFEADFGMYELMQTHHEIPESGGREERYLALDSMLGKIEQVLRSLGMDDSLKGNAFWEMSAAFVAQDSFVEIYGGTVPVPEVEYE